ncbi:MAG TPA: hypothetical protein VN622_07370 [Clostridia bacterium]|nr:hypothetical protein [Clostridia bacterium]
MPSMVMNTSIVRLLWLSGILLEGILSAVIFRKKLYRVLPAFSTYTLAGTLIDLTLWGVQKHYAVYFYTYWFSETVLIFLNGWIILEMYGRLQTMYPVVRTVVARTLVIAGAVFSLLSYAMVVFGPNKDISRLPFILMSAERSFMIVQLGALLALFMIVYSFGLKMTQYDRGIAVGLAIMSAATLTMVTLVASVGRRYEYILTILDIFGAVAASSIWLVAVVIPEKTQAATSTIPALRIEEWDAALSEMLNK